jgi:hypothetical protein
MNTNNTFKDTVACTAVLFAMLVGTASVAYVAYTEVSPVAVAGLALEA